MGTTMASAYTPKALFDASGLVIVITGGAGGIGKIMAHTLATNGAKAIYLLDINEDGLTDVKNSSTAPHVIHPVICNVVDKDSLAAAADRVRTEVGYCDVVFANAGILKGNTGNLFETARGPDAAANLQQTLWSVQPEDMMQTLSVNVMGVYFTAVAFLTLLDQANRRPEAPQQKPQIIVTCSAVSFLREQTVGFSYHASKAAAAHIFKMLGTTLAPLRIRVNALAPGFFPTDMTRGWFQGDPRCEGAVPSAVVPLGRTGREEEMAGAVLYLVSKAGAYLNGLALLIEGGGCSVIPSTY
ncbi:hypothetical protein CDD80_4550 [Ophiocordyceps camponoti-rufipedis]|uniref:Uncharacterized protein n=1 Tax=Ophiocordyceps camponoti-rufipedis TaxID=2004952 RepID=A0A2C5YXD9_9HYPO|nr:hypothetical protein CDD80_4550 [Ophiocordyceps camponoti-rufipedis]